MSRRRRFFHSGLGTATAVLMIASVPATAAETSKKPTQETVTVKAIRPTVQVLPNRTIYSLENNIQSSTSSLSDVLRNLPSVDVDIKGDVSLRGDSNVTILIDGKQSPLLAGDRADALQQIPADMVDRIEVITNPSAEFRAEGSGGIINIILKKDKEQTTSGLVRINIGNEGRINASASGKIKLGRLSLNGTYGEWRNAQRSAAVTLRSDGPTPTSSQDIASKKKSSGHYATLMTKLDINGRNEIELGGNYVRWAGHSSTEEHNVSFPDASDITRTGPAHWQRESVGAQFGYNHKFETKDEEFSLDVLRHTSWGRYSTDFTSFITATGVADYWQSRLTISRASYTELKANYTMPLPSQGKFKAGYALQNDSTLGDNYGLWRDPTMADWSPDHTFINLFTLDRTIHAGYVSYEQRFGRFGVMSGLRLEQDFLTTDLKTTGEVHDTSTLGFYPSLHLSYSLTDTQQLRLSYSRRMNRPETGALNPGRYSNDAFNVWAGNPDLKPEQVDSFETSYRYTGERLEAVVTGYYRATYKGITSVHRYLSPTVLLTTVDNLARRMASGVETNLNASLLPSLKLRASGSLAYSEFNPGAQGVGIKQSGMNWNIKGGLDWQATPDDLFQFNARYVSKQRFAQGYSEPSMTGDLGFKHSFDGGFAAVVSVNNLFNSWNRNTVLDSPGLHQVDHRTTLGRVYFTGLVYTFGGAKDTGQTPNGDNDGGAPGGP